MGIVVREKKMAAATKQRKFVGTRKANKLHVPRFLDDDDDDGSINIYRCLAELEDKRKFAREIALSSMVEAFTNEFQSEFAEKNFATTLYRCLYFVKRGSSKESLSASRAIGLLALTVTSKENAHEVYEASLPQISQVLVSKNIPTEFLLSILDCLAVVTFHGANNCEETEKSMELIWDFIHREHGSEVVATKKSAADVLAAAISAWSFLLTTMERWLISYNTWKRAITFFSSLLENEDKSVHAAAVEALSLIVELDCLQKFSTELNNSVDRGQDSKGKLIEEVSTILVKASTQYIFEEESTIQDDEDSLDERKSKSDFGEDTVCSSAIWDVLNISEDHDNLETDIVVGDFTLTLKWSQLVQLNFLKRFLGGGFMIHMQKNELLHSVFEFAPNETQHVAPWDEHDFTDSEKVVLQFYLPKLKHKKGYQRVYRSPNSVYCKARSQWMKRLHTHSTARNFQSMCA